MPKMTKFARAVDCPTCGATPSHQKWKPRKTVDLDDYTPISDCIASIKRRMQDWDEIETIPRYCPWCGTEVPNDAV